MTNKKELNDEQLEKANGGYHDTKIQIDYEYHPLDQYDTANYIGREVVIFGEREGFVACGTLIDSFEKTVDCGTRRNIKIKLNPNYENYYKDKDVFCVDKLSNFSVHLVNSYDK